MKTKTVYAYFHHSEIELPFECVMDCTQQGANDDAVDFWQRTCADIKYPNRKDMIEGLADTGGWTRAELSELNEDELEQKTLWVACWNARDEMRE
jgi:hypothetical protein